MGVIFNAVGAVICALTIAFIAGWKLSFIVLLFTPLMVFAGILQGRRMANAKKPNEKKTGNLSWSEQGGTVEMFISPLIINKNLNILVCNRSNRFYSNSSWTSSRTIFYFSL